METTDNILVNNLSYDPDRNFPTHTDLSTSSHLFVNFERLLYLKCTHQASECPCVMDIPCEIVRTQSAHYSKE